MIITVDNERELELFVAPRGGTPVIVCHGTPSCALAPERVLSTAVIAGAAPRDAAGLDWFAEQLEDNIKEFRAAASGGETLRRLLEGWRSEMLADSAAEPNATFEHFVAEADRRSITPASAAFAAARQRHALSPGIWGWYDDDLTETVPWGFDLGQITVPVSIWHGGQDRYVALAHGRWLADAIPGARGHLLPTEGHFSLFGTRFQDVLDDLTALARAS
jgi:pimeloyl-ACP methyl ester carboxylesterase